MYVQRYIPHFPAAGEVVIFDRSWYNRAGVEPVMGFCTPRRWPSGSSSRSPAVEKAMVDSGIILIKYWLEVGPDEQTRRLESRIDDPRKIWKLSDMDLKSYSRWYDYSRARDDMFAATDTAWAPWFVANTDDKKRGRLNVITHLLGQIPYEPLHAAERQAAQSARSPAGTSSRTSRCATSREVLTRHDPTPDRSRQGSETDGSDRSGRRRAAGAVAERWYALSRDEVAERLGVDPTNGLAAADGRRAAAERRAQRAARREAPSRGGGASSSSTAAYMQIILLIAGVVSLAIGEWSTGACCCC